MSQRIYQAPGSAVPSMQGPQPTLIPAAGEPTNYFQQGLAGGGASLQLDQSQFDFDLSPSQGSVLFTGTITANDVVVVTIVTPGNALREYQYTVLVADTLSTVATAIAALIAADTFRNGLVATTSGPTVFLTSISGTYISLLNTLNATFSGGATIAATVTQLAAVGPGTPAGFIAAENFTFSHTESHQDGPRLARHYVKGHYYPADAALVTALFTAGAPIR